MSGNDATTEQRYRDGERETRVAQQALEILGLLAGLAGKIALSDPLRDGVEVAVRALALALRVMPILRVSQMDEQRTDVLSEHVTAGEASWLWCGPTALAEAAEATPRIRAKLDALIACAYDRPGPGDDRKSERMDIVGYVVASGRLLVDDLRRAGKLLELKAISEWKEGDAGVARLPYVLGCMAHAESLYLARYRRQLDPDLLLTALIASTQDTLRGGRPGNLPKGAPNHLLALTSLVTSAGIETPTKQVIQNDYRAARARAPAAGKSNMCERDRVAAGSKVPQPVGDESPNPAVRRAARKTSRNSR